MYSQNSQGKASKGAVQLKNSNGRLQLVFSHPIVTQTEEIIATAKEVRRQKARHPQWLS
ncbi:hypothetical protein [Umezakia ovalisporum]|jgi:hypothetical protein|uniref:Uncharacterized protein n=2 Tax=Umezakia ovalisporum TaxID=75695 RepID=A0AA43GWU5_9CYAN|nr:hypothetical protein [Umezakia ovalisporum]MDH6056829.1 hypothetical protein [Umezakia ovalisporum FSS-43]MDH6063069.1 hypothetical protein [Umezakia ovalisporum FSS-62]MDH6068680.1 hypothetical protein [Umezakia ovalisporum APH033B]MDH6071789.1 hypothetical protein [Umezakia ovalisporum CobakiLakeA]MDH6074867.1 hypothetical protein [Umezakia ovalisporum CS-1034]